MRCDMCGGSTRFHFMGCPEAPEDETEEEAEARKDAEEEEAERRQEAREAQEEELP